MGAGVWSWQWWGWQPDSTLCRPLETTRKRIVKEQGQEKKRGSEGRRESRSQNKTQKTEATSQAGRHSDPTQVARPRRSQIVLCHTRAIQQEQDAVCGMSQTPWRYIVACVLLCVCVHVCPSVNFCKRLTRDNSALLSVKCLTVNESLIGELDWPAWRFEGGVLWDNRNTYFDTLPWWMRERVMKSHKKE